MKAEDVRLHHIRDHPWPQKFCAKCRRLVPTYHAHFKADKDDKIAIPEIASRRME